MKNILEKVINIIAITLDIDESKLNGQSGPGTLAIWDSLAMLNIVSAIENKFDFVIDLDDMISITCIDDIVDIIKNKSPNSSVPLSLKKQNQLDLSSFRIPNKFISGTNTIDEIQNYIENKTVIIIGSGKYADSINSKISELLSNLRIGIDYIVCKKEAGEPTDEKIDVLISKITFIPNIIVGIGGGSVLDTCKFVYTKLSYPKSSLQNWSKPFSLPIPAKRIKLISIPTTHGTGSEVSSAGVLSNESFGKSVTLSHQYISDVVIHDPNLLIDLPINIAIDSALDAFTHAIEGYLSKIINKSVYPLVIESISLLMKCIGNKKNFSDARSKGEMLWASYLAGIIQNYCSVGLCHSLAHQLSRFGISHGRLNGIFLPKVLSYNYSMDNTAMNKLARDIGLVNGQNIISWLKDVQIEYNIKGLSNNFDLTTDSEFELLCKDIKSDITYATTPYSIENNHLINMINDSI